MKSNRGSAALVAIIFMMFLSIIGMGFMPLMSSEIKHASMDADEQQAWYAAEAGIKYLKAYSAEADTVIKPNIGQQIILSDNKEQTCYKITLKDKEDNIEVDAKTTNFPVAGRTYMVYSEGMSNGAKKIITAEMIFTESNAGGGEGGDSGGETINLPGVIQTEGKVTITNSNQNITGDIYAKDFTDRRGDQGAGSHNKGVYPTALATNIPESVFQQSTYGPLTTIDSTGQWEPITVEAGKQYVINWPLSYNWGYKFIGASDAVIFVHNLSPFVFYTTDGIVGPSTGKPVTFIFDSAVTLNTKISGNVRIIAKGDVILSNVGDISGLFMVATNGDIAVNRSIDKGFLSSNGSINLNSSCARFVGQIQAKKDVTVDTGNIIYDNTVSQSEGFVLPNGMK